MSARRPRTADGRHRLQSSAWSTTQGSTSRTLIDPSAYPAAATPDLFICIGGQGGTVGHARRAGQGCRCQRPAHQRRVPRVGGQRSSQAPTSRRAARVSRRVGARGSRLEVDYRSVSSKPGSRTRQAVVQGPLSSSVRRTEPLLGASPLLARVGGGHPGTCGVRLGRPRPRDRRGQAYRSS